MSLFGIGTVRDLELAEKYFKMALEHDENSPIIIDIFLWYLKALKLAENHILMTKVLILLMLMIIGSTIAAYVF